MAKQIGFISPVRFARALCCSQEAPSPPALLPQSRGHLNFRARANEQRLRRLRLKFRVNAKIDLDQFSALPPFATARQRKYKWSATTARMSSAAAPTEVQ